jgi:phosphate acetyltransferase
MFHEVIAHGMWGAALISTVLGTEFPGPGTIYIRQTLRFSRPVKVGDTISVTLSCKQKFEHNKHMIFDCQCTNQDGLKVISGEAEVLAPAEKIRRPRAVLPEVVLSDRAVRYRRLLDRAKGLEPATVAFAYPLDAGSLRGALAARDEGLIEPMLAGPAAELRALAAREGLDISGCRIVDVPYSHSAVAAAVALSRAGEAEVLAQGSLPTDEFLRPLVAPEGARTSRRLSHVLFIDIPTYPRPVIISDMMVNIEPTLADKVDITQNAIDFAHMMGIVDPKVAVLAATETVTPKMRATLDAAALCKMADRGQIAGGVVDGPLGFDNAVSLVSARTAGLKSAVAGQADILIAPDLESGNMLAKQLEHLSDAVSGGVVLGGRVPIVLANRGDSLTSRVASFLLAFLVARAAPRAGAK